MTAARLTMAAVLLALLAAAPAEAKLRWRELPGGARRPLRTSRRAARPLRRGAREGATADRARRARLAAGAAP